MKERPIILTGSEEEKQHFYNLYDRLADENGNPTKDIAVPLPNTRKQGYSPIYRNKYAIECNQGEIIELIDPRLNTGFNFWENAVNLWPNNDCLGERKVQSQPPVFLDKENGSLKKTRFDNFYTFQTYKEVDTLKTWIGSGIVELVTNHPKYRPAKELIEVYPDFDERNVNSKQNATKFVVSILSGNRSEWMIADLACQAYSLCTTTLYDNLGAETSKYILDLVKSPIIFTTKNKILNLLSLKKQFPKELSNLLIIISFDSLNLQHDFFFHKFAADVGVDLYDFHNLAQLGKMNPYEFIRPTPCTPYTVCFTSGTTGVSKGVYITQGNLATSMTFCFHHWPRPYKENRIGHAYKDKQLRSYCLLPLAHIYERQTTIYSLVSNIAIGFPTGNISTRVEDCSILKPNYIQAVPRIYSRIEQELKAVINDDPVVKRVVETKFKLLFNQLLEKTINNQDVRKHNAYFRFNTPAEALEYEHLNMIVTKKLRKLQGFDNVKYCLSASAPISLVSQNFICTVLNIGFIQNYGASEVTSACTAEAPFSLRITKEMLMFDKGSAKTTSGKKKSIVSCSGPVGVTTDVKLRDLPDLGYVYDSKDGKPKGEVLFKGPQVFKKYVFRHDITKDSFEDNYTWYRTGDICEIGNDGKLYVIDRIKNFFKLSQGEYLTPERIENIYLSNVAFVNQCFIHGYSDKDYVVGVLGIVPRELAKFLIRIMGNGKPHISYNESIDQQTLSKLKDIIRLIESFEFSISNEQLEQAQEIELKDLQQQYLNKLLNLLNKDIRLKKLVLYKMNNLVADNPNVSLASYEKLNNIHLGYYPLKISTGLLTPTLKLQRPTSIKKYNTIIDNLYEEGSLLRDSHGEIAKL